MSASVESNRKFNNLTITDKQHRESKYAGKSTICLNMIVKDESHIIKQTLTTLIKYIDFAYWVICDTGSSDNTVDIIETFFQKHQIPGEIHHNKWVDFAHNRNLALGYAKDKAEYTFIFDADDDIQGDLVLPRKLTEPSYLLKFAGFGSEYYRPLLIKSDLDWKWYGVLHEYITTNPMYDGKHLSGDYFITSGRTGNRNKDPNKYLKDAKVLESAYNTEKDPNLFTRYSFYCAQSYRDAEHREEALYWYKNTTKLDTWVEEKYYSYLMAGRLLIELNRPEEALIQWLHGQALNVNRSECFYEIAKYYRSLNNMPMAFSFALLAKRTQTNSNGLFYEANIHDYLIDYELSLSAYYVNEIKIGLASCLTIIDKCDIPKYVEQTKINIKYYQ